MLEGRLNYRPWVFGTLIYADIKLERWGRLVWTGPSYTMTADKQHREFTVPVFICKRVTETPLCCLSHNAGFPFSLSLHHHNNRLENISIYYLPLFNSVAKNLFLGRKSIGGTFAPLAVCVVLLKSHKWSEEKHRQCFPSLLPHVQHDISFSPT